MAALVLPKLERSRCLVIGYAAITDDRTHVVEAMEAVLVSHEATEACGNQRYPGDSDHG